MVWEPANRPESSDHPHKRSSLLLVSVKDSARFDGGWGSFGALSLMSIGASAVTLAPDNTLQGSSDLDFLVGSI